MNGLDVAASLLFWAISLVDGSGILSEIYQRNAVLGGSETGPTLAVRFPTQVALLLLICLICSTRRAAERQLEEVRQSFPARKARSKSCTDLEAICEMWSDHQPETNTFGPFQQEFPLTQFPSRN